jgi:hypothetical protein
MKTRIALIPVLLSAAPAMAHPLNAAHLHRADAVSMMLGLTLIAAGIGAAVFARRRAR